MKLQKLQTERTGAFYFSKSQLLTKKETGKKTVLKGIVILAMLCITLPSQNIYGQNTTHNNVTVSGTLSFGSSTRQMIKLWGNGYAIGVQSGTQYFRSNNNFAWYKGGTHNNNQFNPGGGTRLMVLKQDGSLGIGTTATAGYKLVVKGKVKVKGLKVTNNGWADFVFYDDYKLPTLEEVEQHIEEKGHLKDIPSAEEVLKNGTDLAEMDALLLQKIEELTLYLIEQNKQLKTQNKRLKALEQENTVLKKQVKQ